MKLSFQESPLEGRQRIHPRADAEFRNQLQKQLQFPACSCSGKLRGICPSQNMLLPSSAYPRLHLQALLPLSKTPLRCVVLLSIPTAPVLHVLQNQELHSLST